MSMLAQARPWELSVDQVLAPYVYVFYVAFGLAFVLTPVMRQVALHYGIVDNPDKLRKMHDRPVAYLGGVAVFAGWLAGLTLSLVVQLHYNPPDVARTVPMPFSIIAGAGIIVLLGLFDDIYHISPKPKILGQVIAAGALLANGIGTECTRPLLNPLDVRLQQWFAMAPLPDWFFILTGSAVTVALVVFCCNAANLMDGLDGLCGGVTTVIAGGFLFLAVYLAMKTGPDDAEWAAVRIVLALALLGGVLGFIPYNFNPASIFMGDTGSMFLGFACALMIVLMGEVDSRWMLGALVMFSLPVLDTSLAFARRYVNGRPLFSADKQHLHHQLVSRGLSVKQAVLLSYGMALFFALAGGSVVFMRTRYALALYMVVFGCIIVAAYKMGMVHERPGTSSRSRLAEPAGPPEGNGGATPH